MGHQCQNQRLGRSRSGDARVTSALLLPHERRLRQWALRNDHSHRPQEQPQ